MLQTFTIETFSPLVNDVFHIARDGAPPLPLQLATVTALTGGGPLDPLAAQRRTPFSLLFHGPRDLILAQQIVRLEHATLGAVELFIVPLGLDAQGMRYEAIFT